MRSRGNNYAAMSDPDKNPHFRRTWNEPLQIGAIVQEITKATALKSITRLLGLIPETSGSDREELFEAADEIREAGGLNWADVLAKKAA